MIPQRSLSSPALPWTAAVLTRITSASLTCNVGGGSWSTAGRSQTSPPPSTPPSDNSGGGSYAFGRGGKVGRSRRNVGVMPFFGSSFCLIKLQSCEARRENISAKCPRPKTYGGCSSSGADSAPFRCPPPVRCVLLPGLLSQDDGGNRAGDEGKLREGPPDSYATGGSPVSSSSATGVRSRARVLAQQREIQVRVMIRVYVCSCVRVDPWLMLLSS